MPILNRNGTALYYEVHGEGQPLLLTHGFMCTSEIWTAQIDALSRHLKLILWDLRGHGRTLTPDGAAQYSEEAAINDMAALLDEVGAQDAIVGGHSLGGYLSLMFHLLFPERVRALVLVGTGPGFRNDEARTQWNARAIRKADRLESEGLRGGEAAAYVHHMGAKALAMAARGIVTQRDGRVIEHLSHVHVPCLVVLGESDTPFLAAADAMSQKIPGARKVTIAGARHNVNSDQPKLFNDAVLEFLREMNLLS
jgi:pimeloyl-ACP methyl ester carboxylesterase